MDRISLQWEITTINYSLHYSFVCWPGLLFSLYADQEFWSWNQFLWILAPGQFFHGILVLEPAFHGVLVPGPIFHGILVPGTSFHGVLVPEPIFHGILVPGTSLPWTIGPGPKIHEKIGPGDQFSIDRPTVYFQATCTMHLAIFQAQHAPRTNDSAASSPATRATGSTLHMVANSHAIYFLIVI